MMTFTEDEALIQLKAWIKKHGTQKQAAKAMGISEQYLSNVLTRQRPPKYVLERIGIKQVIRYQRS